MIEVIHYKNESTEKPLESSIDQYYEEVRELLPTLPETVKIYFGDYGIIPESGVGGFAYSRNVITISLAPDFDDKEKQMASIRPMVFHEAFHLYQEYTGETGPFSAIDNAIYEGMATVFEREYAGVFEPYGDYRQTPEEKLKQWIEELQKINAEVFADEKVYRKWKFYHPELQERWIVYRVGTWLIDQVLEKHRLNIMDLKDKTAADVLRLFEQGARSLDK